MSGEDPSPRTPAEHEQLLRQVVEGAPVALLQIDTDGVVRMAAGTALQIPPEQMLGCAISELAESAEQVEWVHRALAGEHLRELTSWGGKSWQVHYAPLRDAGTVTGVAAVFTEVIERAEVRRPADPGTVHLQAAIEAAAEALIVLDPQGVVTLANARCSELFGAPVLPGTALRDLLDAPTVDLVDHQLARRAAGQRDRYELAIGRPDGTTVWLLVSAGPMFTVDGQFLGSVALLTDITTHKAVEQQLQRAARTDSLTGVANRATLADRLSHALARRDAGIVAVLFCDVDELKSTNDRLGHAAGDELLRRVARRITATLRPADTVARYGGDEFVVVCEELHTPAEAAQLAERIRLAVAGTDAGADASTEPGTDPGTDPGTALSTVSIGVATAPPHDDADRLLAAADAAAYTAKRAGRNRVHLT